MRIKFDTSGVGYSCPKSDIGLVTSAECQSCPLFVKFIGFDVICKHDKPEMTDDSGKFQKGSNRKYQ